MTNKDNLITENIVTATGVTYTSAAGMLIPYNDGTEISRNDLSFLPYNGISYGYGWGANDAGGNPVYYYRGLYDYQPEYQTPTTQKNGLILKNVVHDFGLMHTDLGGIYTLSASPSTNITGNVIFSGGPTATGTGECFRRLASWLSADLNTAYHHDEGSRFYVDSESVVNVTGNTYGGVNDGWFQPNESQNQTTGNLTAFDIAVAVPLPLQATNGTNSHGDDVFDIVQYSAYSELSQKYKEIYYEAGIPPAQRSYRPVSFNPAPPS
jgi:hypothetical protein